MLTREDLQAIGELIKTEGAAIRKDMVTKQDLEANNRVLGTIFKVELAETNKRIDTIAQDTKYLKKGQEHIEEKLDEKAEERFKQLEDRIKALEEQLRKVKVVRG